MSYVVNNTITYEDKSSTLALLSIPRTPTFVPNSGVLTKSKITIYCITSIEYTICTE